MKRDISFLINQAMYVLYIKLPKMSMILKKQAHTLILTMKFVSCHKKDAGGNSVITCCFGRPLGIYLGIRTCADVWYSGHFSKPLLGFWPNGLVGIDLFVVRVKSKDGCSSGCEGWLGHSLSPVGGWKQQRWEGKVSGPGSLEHTTGAKPGSLLLVSGYQGSPLSGSI